MLVPVSPNHIFSGPVLPIHPQAILRGVPHASGDGE